MKTVYSRTYFTKLLFEKLNFKFSLKLSVVQEILFKDKNNNNDVAKAHLSTSLKNPVSSFHFCRIT